MLKYGPIDITTTFLLIVVASIFIQGFMTGAWFQEKLTARKCLKNSEGCQYSNQCSPKPLPVPQVKTDEKAAEICSPMDV